VRAFTASVHDQLASWPLPDPATGKVPRLVHRQQFQEKETTVAAAQVRVLHQRPENIPLEAVDDCTVQAMALSVGLPLLVTQRTDHCCLETVDELVPPLVVLVVVSAEPQRELVLRLQLDVLPNAPRTVRRGLGPPTNLLDRHREIERHRLAAA
jgi:hypothetical protein